MLLNVSISHNLLSLQDALNLHFQKSIFSVFLEDSTEDSIRLDIFSQFQHLSENENITNWGTVMVLLKTIIVTYVRVLEILRTPIPNRSILFRMKKMLKLVIQMICISYGDTVDGTLFSVKFVLFFCFYFRGEGSSLKHLYILSNFLSQL